MTTLTWASDGDANGIMYWLGTLQGGYPWRNPAAWGWVVARQSTAYPGSSPTSEATDRAGGVVHSTEGTGNWVAWDLGSGVTLDVNRYSLRNRLDYEGHHLSNWVLEGTNDVAAITDPAAATWTVVKTHTSESAGTAGSWRNWTITPSTAYRHFRIRNTGTDNLGYYYLTFSEIEFYGEATAGPPPPPPTHFLSPSGITNEAGTLAVQTGRTTVFDPSGITISDGELDLQTLRAPNYFWSSTISTWKLPERTFNYVDVGGLGMILTLPARTYAPAWAGSAVARTTGQIWPM